MSKPFFCDDSVVPTRHLWRSSHRDGADAASALDAKSSPLTRPKPVSLIGPEISLIR